MEWYDIVAWVIAGVAVLALIVLVIRRLPKTASIDLNAMPTHRQKAKKHSIAEQRLARKLTSAKTVAAKGSAPVRTRVKQAGKRWYNKVQKLEQKYRTPKTAKPKTKEEKEIARQRLADLMRQGVELMDAKNWVEAEKKLIEVVSLDKQYTDAYKRLGKVYIEMKDAEYAIETLEFAKKLAPEDEEVWFILGTAYLEVGKPDRAVENLKKATQMVKRNPKYLDALIEAAIAMPDKFTAERAWETLKAVNPENQKLAELRKRIDAIETVGKKEKEKGKEKK